MKRYWLASLFGVGIMCGLSSVVYAVDLEAVLKDNTTNSGFSVKDASGNTIARFRGDGNVGIGTTGPSAKLEVNVGSSNDEQIKLVSTTTIGSLSINVANGSGDGSYGVTADGGGWIRSKTAGKFIRFDTSVGEAMRIANSGNVGIGTTAPTDKLTINDGVSAVGSYNAIRLEKGTGFGGTYLKQYYTDVNNYGLSIGWLSDRLTINQDNGNVGIGTTTPVAKLHVNGNVYIEKDSPAISLKATSGTQKQWDQWVADSGNFYIQNSNTPQAITIQPDGNVGIGTLNPSYKLYVAGAAYSTGGWSGSDVRWKKDITPLENSLNNVLKLQGVHYYWKTDEYPDKGFTKEKQIGLIAQDVEKVIPELVNTSEDGYKSVSYEKLTAVLVEAVKELKAENNKLKSEVNELRTLINKVIESPAMPASHKQSCAGVYDNDGI